MNTIRGGLTLMTAAVLAPLLSGAVGCGHEARYEDRRPPVDSLVYDNDGVQALDVTAATDHFARDLVASPALNASQTRWTVVLSQVENKTADPAYSYEAFDSRLKGLLGRLGQGRVALIENKAKYHQLQNEELETPAPSGPGGYPAGIQPDYDLYLTISELPNRATSYFLITGKLVNLKTRVIEWTSPNYEFQAAR